VFRNDIKKTEIITFIVRKEYYGEFDPGSG
jgi:hypothetical protein